MYSQRDTFAVWHLVGGGFAAVIALASVQILAAPVGEYRAAASSAALRTVTLVPTSATSGSASDDARTGTVVVRESPPSSDGIQNAPEQIANVLFPTSIESVAATRGIVVDDALRLQALELFARVVPESVEQGATAEERNAAEAFIAIGPAGVTADHTCVNIGAGQRAALLDAFVRTQGFLPKDTADYQFMCALVTDPRNPIDITKVFPRHRRIDLEPYALKTFIAFFGRLPSKAKDGTALAPTAVEKDWWAVKYMTYFPILTASFRDLNAERACTKEFRNDPVVIYKDGQRMTKLAGQVPTDVWEWSFVRACAYSGAPFLEQFTKR